MSNASSRITMHHGTLKQRLGNLNEVEVWNLIIKYLCILNFARYSLINRLSSFSTMFKVYVEKISTIFSDATMSKVNFKPWSYQIKLTPSIG